MGVTFPSLADLNARLVTRYVHLGEGFRIGDGHAGQDVAVVSSVLEDRGQAGEARQVSQQLRGDLHPGRLTRDLPALDD